MHPAPTLRALVVTLLAVLMLMPWPPALADLPVAADQAPEAAAETPIGSGDGRIHVIPSLSPYSVKNGETLTVTAIVRSERPVATVTANLGGLATVTLQPNARLGGVSADGTTGIYTAEWTSAGLEERVYAATLTVTDTDGHAWTDHSLLFSDAAAKRLGQSGAKSSPALMAHAGTAILPVEFPLSCAVIDTAGGYAYFGTGFGSSPAFVVKVALGSGVAPPTRVGSVQLELGEKELISAVIDTDNGYAYFGTRTSPGRVVKVALGSGSNLPMRVGALTLEAEENDLRAAVIDTDNGYAYFGTGTSPGRVVKVALGSNSSPPTRVGVVTFESGENHIESAVIDVAGGYAYFGAYGDNFGRVVKVALGSGSNPPRRVGALALVHEDGAPRSAVIDTANGYVYFGTTTSPARVVKVALGSGGNLPTRVGAATLNSGEAGLYSAVIDTATGLAYFGTGTSPGRVVKMALGTGNNPPTRVRAVTLESGDNGLHAAVIDPAGGHAYFGIYDRGRVVKVALGSENSFPFRRNAVELVYDESGFECSVIDAAEGYAYFGTGTSPGQVVKVALGSGNLPPTRIGSVKLSSGEDHLRSAVIDAANGYAYFGTRTSPGRVVKVALGIGDIPPTRVGAVTLISGENDLTSAVIDAINGFAYFGTNTSPGWVVKVTLGIGNSPPTRAGALRLSSGEAYLVSAAIDDSKMYAYFGTATSPGRVVKVALGSGSNLPTRVGAVTLEIGEDALYSASIDSANGYLYLKSLRDPPRVLKVALGEGDAAPTRVAGLVLDNSDSGHCDTVIAPSTGFLYYGTHHGHVVAVALGSGSNPPTRVGAFALNDGENSPRSAVIDTARGHAYFGNTGRSPGRVVKLALHAGELEMTLTPAAALQAGAAWRRVGGTDWQSSGNLIPFPVGENTVEFRPVPGWKHPTRITTTITEGMVTQLSAHYESGALSVTLAPSRIITDGAQWRRLGTSVWRDSGTTESPIPTGEHTVEFKSVPYWTTPEPVVVTILDGQTRNVSATYQTPPPTAAFTAFPTVGTVPFECWLVNRSTGLYDLVRWDFDNNGTFDFTGEDWLRTITEPGVYRPRMRVSGPGGQTTLVYPGEILALPAPAGVGDLNADGQVGSTDEQWMADLILGRRALLASLLVSADLNADGQVDAADLVALRRYLAGQITELPIVSGPWIALRAPAPGQAYPASDGIGLVPVQVDVGNFDLGPDGRLTVAVDGLLLMETLNNAFHVPVMEGRRRLSLTLQAWSGHVPSPQARREVEILVGSGGSGLSLMGDPPFSAGSLVMLRVPAAAQGQPGQEVAASLAGIATTGVFIDSSTLAVLLPATTPEGIYELCVTFPDQRRCVHVAVVTAGISSPLAELQNFVDSLLDELNQEIALVQAASPAQPELLAELRGLTYDLIELRNDLPGMSGAELTELADMLRPLMGLAMARQSSAGACRPLITYRTAFVISVTAVSCAFAFTGTTAPLCLMGGATLAVEIARIKRRLDECTASLERMIEYQLGGGTLKGKDEELEELEKSAKSSSGEFVFLSRKPQTFSVRRIERIGDPGALAEIQQVASQLATVGATVPESVKPFAQAGGPEIVSAADGATIRITRISNPGIQGTISGSGSSVTLTFSFDDPDQNEPVPFLFEIDGPGSRGGTFYSAVLHPEVDDRDFDLSACNQWTVANSGGYGTTVDDWNISNLPVGAVIDFRYEAFGIPDRFVVRYQGATVLDTGVISGSNELNGVFIKDVSNMFRVTVYGEDQGTAWNYQVRARCSN